MPSEVQGMPVLRHPRQWRQCNLLQGGMGGKQEQHCSGKYGPAGGEKEGVWVRRSSGSSACCSPVGRSMGRCCWLEPPDELEEQRDGGATPVLVPNRESSRPGCFMLYAWT